MSAFPTVTSDRVCTPCNSSTYQDESGHTLTSCKPVTACAVGSVQTSPPTSQSNRVCMQCPNTTYSTGSVCAPLSFCPAGQYVTVAATITSDRVCGNCTVGIGYQDIDQNALTTCKVLV